MVKTKNQEYLIPLYSSCIVTHFVICYNMEMEIYILNLFYCD